MRSATSQLLAIFASTIALYLLLLAATCLTLGSSILTPVAILWYTLALLMALMVTVAHRAHTDDDDADWDWDEGPTVLSQPPAAEGQGELGRLLHLKRHAGLLEKRPRLTTKPAPEWRTRADPLLAEASELERLIQLKHRHPDPGC